MQISMVITIGHYEHVRAREGCGWAGTGQLDDGHEAMYSSGDPNQSKD